MTPDTPIRIETLTGQAITPYLPALARLRIEIFRDWPYLYDGAASYEQDYMRSYAASPGAAVILALAGEEPVGAATCLPLADETENIKAPFEAAGLDLSKFFYFGESVLLHGYRKRGIGVAFFTAREAHARGFGAYGHTAFCAVQRPDSHPMRPKDHVPLDAFWTRRGYLKQPQLQCRMRWRDIGEPGETEKTLVFWTKALA